MTAPDSSTPARADAAAPDRPETGGLAGEILQALKYRIGKDATVATDHDWLAASIKVVRDRVIERWIASTKDAYARERKRVYYLSMEFLIGRLMRDAFSNIGMLDEMRAALKLLGVDLDRIAELEPDAALGNGGLGRLAACFMESMATVDIPAHGYGIRYVHGLFRQEFSNGWQVELPETWLSHGNPWEFERREGAYEIGFGGTVESVTTRQGRLENHLWKPQDHLLATPYDTPVVGWRGRRVNTLRLWTATPVDPILLDRFNAGDHIGALEESNKAEAITRVLYPADSHKAGQELRLRQEYFFTSASLQDIVHRHLAVYPDLTNLPDKAAIHLNDTHPAVAVAELMRILMDVHRHDFDTAWDITRGTIAYTNHTLLPEALESWPVTVFERILPRHMQIIYAINAEVLLEARARGLDDEAIRNISLIHEDGERRIRMGNLAFVGSHSINGVSALHTGLMKETVFADLHAVYPGRMNNKTNGITPRRWLFQCNPGLTGLVRETIGDAFLDDIDRLADLDRYADDAGFREKFAGVKRANKERLAAVIHERTDIRLDPSALFDVQIKRIHEYKRQLLNILEAVALYDQIRAHPEIDWVPRVKFFGGKAAPSYHNAKLIIKLVNDVARVINSDPAVRGLLKIVFVPNYNVSMAELMVPAADLSEQISTAGMEASGTGNMKFALNGAITIGTLDGANVEIDERVGRDNIVIFGLTADEVAAKRAEGYRPREVIQSSRNLAHALEAIRAGRFSPDEPERFAGLVDGLEERDWFMVAADFDAYAGAQRAVDRMWKNSPGWTKAAIHNTARVAWFSSDRTIRDYARDVWKVPVA
ncbi:MAG: glycogen/starch/alpha-glucan phosphorylase [Rhizobiaceae bacterium]|nr:glycogen/starch/alpha-glucan phosphorylase [Rhizobiaceae bacterium]MCV0405571.1 glycogen/starch/alpha-glucan phosphorylase [Rhizobiaceae bacterium]